MHFHNSERLRDDTLTKHKQKIFTKNDEAVRYARALKRRGRYPFKHTVVEWDEE